MNPFFQGCYHDKKGPKNLDVKLRRTAITKIPALPLMSFQAMTWLFICLLLVACVHSNAGTMATATPVQPTQVETSIVVTELMSEQANTGLTLVPEVSVALSTALPPPLRLSIPAERQEPLSAWRPPLYPTPWALGPYDHFYFARPIAADQVNWPEEDYRYGGNFFDDVIHTGVDIPVPKGTPVLATGSGKIIWAGYGAYRGGYDKTDPYGQSVVIRHDFGYQGQPLYTLYGHLDQVDVAEGQHVTVGQVIGLSGETGQVTGPHLHFEVRLGANDYFKTRNPELWMVPPQGWGVLAARIMDTNRQLLPYQEIIVTNLATDQNWKAKSYGRGAVNDDPYYRENLVIGDLPAGLYLVRIPYAGLSFTLEFEVRPGVVSFFSFAGRSGFDTTLPEPPGSDFNPDVTPTPKK
jgi:murein DD-endopeptidase MepM/ murein hydrolase activator NlpD